MKRDKIKEQKIKPNINFRGMAFLFKIRDKFHPPIKKVQKAGIKVGDFILDYGCGPGGYTIAAAEIVGVSGKVYAADIHPLAIKKVQIKANKKKLKNVETILTKCKTNLEDNSIDVILCFDVLHGINDKDCILKEFYRVLKLRCIFSFDDHHMKENEIIETITSTGLFKLIEKNEKQYNFTKIE
ncbi:MAG: class I SAM-dependent methyltransferase [Candidatus Hodarchaeota archaeon]